MCRLNTSLLPLQIQFPPSSSCPGLGLGCPIWTVPTCFFALQLLGEFSHLEAEVGHWRIRVDWDEHIYSLLQHHCLAPPPLLKTTVLTRKSSIKLSWDIFVSIIHRQKFSDLLFTAGFLCPPCWYVYALKTFAEI